MTTLPFPVPGPYPRSLRLWEPEAAPRGIVVISHGMAEHIARYEALGLSLAAAGFEVCGYNHLGHGEEAPRKGYFADDKGWNRLIQDLDSVIRLMAQRRPGLPIVLLGHSMGSFLAREYVLRHPKGMDALVLSGTGWHPKALCGFGRLMAGVMCALGDARAPSKLLDRLAFSANNKPFLPARTPCDWLSRDAAEVDKYLADPLCGFVFSAGGFSDLFSGLWTLSRLSRLRTLPKGLPVLLISGGADPVGGQGRGVKTIARQYREAGLQGVQVKLYPEARHELFNETNREEVTQDLVAWLEASLPLAKGEDA